ncbi:MAG: TolC family protein [Ferruginibacter sp.]|nr:TolC family protein [Ferruginibacter sp.]
MKYKSILFIATLFCFQVLHAQESRTLTLQEAVDLSLKNSHKLKSNEAKILEATAKVKEAEEKKLPDASISGSYLYLPVKANINLKSGPGNGGGPSINQAIYGIANVSLPIYNGGKINYGIQSSKFLEQAVKLDAENDKETVTLNIISACINLYKAYQAIELVKENLH